MRFMPQLLTGLWWALVETLYCFPNAGLRFVRFCLFPRTKPNKARTVCIYRIGNLGDILCALPAMWAVRIAYPSAKLTLVTSPGRKGLPGAVELLRDARWLDDLFVYYSEDIATVRKQLELVKRLRQKRFDVWIELPSSLATVRASLRNMAVARLSGARWGWGWSISTIRWATQMQSESRTFPNEVDRLRRVVEAGGVRVEQVRFPLPLGEHHAAAVDALLQPAVPPAAPLVGIAPGAKRPANRWPLERFADVGRELSHRGFTVVLLGGLDERQGCERIASRIGGAVVNVAGELSVLESCEVLRRCAFLVCNDSGVQHMAAAVCTPCVSIFSAREMPGKWYPYGAQHIVLTRKVPCHSCYTSECPHDNLCVKLVQVPDVMRATERIQRETLRCAESSD